IRKRGETAGVSPLVRSVAAQAAIPPVMRGQFRNAFQGDTPSAPRRCSPLQGPLRQRLTALPPPLKGEAGKRSPLAQKGQTHRSALAYSRLFGFGGLRGFGTLFR